MNTNRYFLWTILDAGDPAREIVITPYAGDRWSDLLTAAAEAGIAIPRALPVAFGHRQNDNSITLMLFVPGAGFCMRVEPHEWAYTYDSVAREEEDQS